MKKLVILVLALVSLSAVAQTKSTTTKYLTIGYSIGNHKDGTTFNEVSYPSIEGGIVCNNEISFGVQIGRNQTKDIFKKDDAIQNYYWEVKLSPVFKLGPIDGNVSFGLGNYFKTDISNYFADYGFGISKTYYKITYGIGASNWAGTNYLTPSITYNF